MEVNYFVYKFALNNSEFKIGDVMSDTIGQHMAEMKKERTYCLFFQHKKRFLLYLFSHTASDILPWYIMLCFAFLKIQ